MAITDIEWADEVLNAARGCQRVSPGCGGGAVKGPNGERGGCYAEAMAARIVRMGGYEWSAELARWVDDPKKKRTPASRANADRYRALVRIDAHGKAQWTGVFTFDPEKLAEALTWKKPRMVFVNSMSDLFGEGLAFEEIAAHFGVFAATAHIIYLVLTKRAKRMAEFFAWLERGAAGPGGQSHALQCGVHAMNRGIEVDYCGLPEIWPLPNVWLGVSAERQKEANERIPLLLRCPAAVRWVSAEPLLDRIDLFEAVLKINGKLDVASGERRWLDWVVWGGESGHGARPCDIEWIRDGVRQCRAAGVTPYVKQLGAHPCITDTSLAADRRARADGFLIEGGDVTHRDIVLHDKKGAEPNEWPIDLRVREWPSGFTPPKSKALPVVQ
jgi:protein gp37